MTKVKSLADLINEEMDRRGLTGNGRQRRAAEEMDLEDSTKLNKWLNSNSEPEIEALRKIAKFVGISSVYDLGPHLIETKIRREKTREQMDGR